MGGASAGGQGGGERQQRPYVPELLGEPSAIEEGLGWGVQMVATIQPAETASCLQREPRYSRQI